MKFIRKFMYTAAIVPLMAGVAAHGAGAASLADAYRGKTVTIMIGYAAGGGYDLYSRTLARFIGKHIPGNPKVIGKNMPGASSLKLSNWMYAVAPKDGTVMATIARGAPVHTMLGGKGARFDATKFNWLGSMNNEVSVCVTSFRAPAKTFNELRFKKTIVGGQGKSSDSEVFSMFVQNLLGAKIKLISGYPGAKPTVLAMERGEVDGICGWSWTSVKKLKPDWLKEKKLNILLQLALVKHPDLPDVPLITDFARNEGEKAQMELIFSRQTMGRPYLLPPGVPADRVAMMRKAFRDTINDPEFQAFTKKAKIEINYVSGEDVQTLIERVLASPKEVVAAAVDNTKHRGDIEKAKLNYEKAIGTIVDVKRGGRRLIVEIGGKKLKTSVSGSRTKLTVNGSKVKRKNIKVGMKCTLTWLGPGSESKNIDCNS
jgi:tripartite-type tricarboxylate transporter receptor subunit TctC